MVILTIILVGNISAQSRNETIEHKHFIGSTLFVLATPLLTPSPKYYQINYGYRITSIDVLSVEAITWKYYGPQGRPWGPNHEDSKTDFPGSVRSFGIGLAYKHIFWKGIYGQIHVTPMKQNYLDEDGSKIQSGFQLFNTFRIGYHIKLFKNRIFIEPSIAATYWPISTNLPDSFQVKENQWNHYFLFEPGLHFGINF